MCFWLATGVGTIDSFGAIGRVGTDVVVSSNVVSAVLWVGAAFTVNAVPVVGAVLEVDAVIVVGAAACLVSAVVEEVIFALDLNSALGVIQCHYSNGTRRAWCLIGTGSKYH